MEHKEMFCWMIGVLIGALSIAGCAGDTALKKDPFFEKWKTLEQTSAGSSPVATPHIIDAGDMAPKGRTSQFEEKPIAAVRLLPTTEISLKMRQADVKSVLRSLALAVGLNILIKNDIKGEVSVDFKAVPWDQAFIGILRMQSLAYVWEGDILRVMSLEDRERDLKQQAQEQSRREVEPLVTKVIRINYANAAGLKENLQEFLKDKDGKPRGSVRVDEHSNSLIIQAVPDDIRRIIPIIEEIDKPTPQILIKANIVETTKDMARNLGIQWGGVFGRSAGNYNMFVTPGGTGGSTVPPGSALPGSYTPAYGSTGVGGQGFGVNFPATGLSSTASGTLGLIFGTIGGNLLELQLSALQKDNKLNILSSPSITTMDNQKASTENGFEVPITILDKLGNPSTTYKLATLKLEIKPHVIDGRNLKMDITVQKDEVSTLKDNYLNPYIIKKLTTTSLIVQDGETIVISGLTKQTNTIGDTGIPLFKDVPILGWLFKSESKNVGMEEVLIFITPTILPPQTAAASQPLTDRPVEKGK